MLYDPDDDEDDNSEDDDDDDASSTSEVGEGEREQVSTEPTAGTTETEGPSVSNEATDKTNVAKSDASVPAQ